MTRLALASLRFRVAASLATFLAVGLGCSLLIASGGLFETALRLSAPPQRLAGAPVIVTGPTGFPLPNQESETVAYDERSGVGADLASRIAAVPGVASALPDVSFPAVAVHDGHPSGAGETTGETVLSGHDWTSAALTPYTLQAGSQPPAGGQVVLDTQTAKRIGATPGDTVELVVAGQPATFTVSGIATPGRGVDAPALFFATADVQRRFARPGTADAIGVLPGAGTSPEDLAQRLEQELPAELTILTGEGRGAAEFTGIPSSRLPLILLAAIFGGMVLTVMALVVWATISLSVRQRQQELALLRATGATPRQVKRMVVAETMVTSLLATIGGGALGRLVGGGIFTLSTQRGVVPATLTFRQGVLPFAAGVVLAVVIPWVTATLAATSAARTRPIHALAEAAIPPVAVGPVRRLLARILAAGMVVLAVTIMFLDPETAATLGGGALLGAIAVALLGPELINVIVGRLTGAIRRVTGTAGALAVINTRARAAQFAAVLTPVTLAVTIAVGNVFAQTTQDAAALRAYLGQFQADAVVTTSAGGVAPELLTQVRDTPGVASASAMVTSQGWIEEPYVPRGIDTSSWPLLGIDAPDQAQGQAPVLATPVTAGSLADLTGNTVALPQRHAGAAGIGLGDQVTMRLGDAAQVNVQVVALLDSPADYGSVLLPADLLAPHTTAGLAEQLLVRAEPGEDRGDRAALIGTLQQQARTWPEVNVGDQRLLETTFAAGQDVAAWISYLLAILAIAYAAIASINALAVVVLSRRQEFALQRLAGATRRQVTRMLLTEAAIIAAIALGLGSVAAAAYVVPTTVAVGLSVPSGPLWVYPMVIAAAFVIVWPVTLVSARLAMRHRPVEAVNSPAA